MDIALYAGVWWPHRLVGRGTERQVAFRVFTVPIHLLCCVCISALSPHRTASSVAPDLSSHYTQKCVNTTMTSDSIKYERMSLSAVGNIFARS